MAEVLVTAAAEAEYLEALLWYAERSAQAATDFEGAFDQALEVISKHADRFPLCDRRHRAMLLRRFPYQVIYRSDHERIIIVAVAHAKREPRYWAGR